MQSAAAVGEKVMTLQMQVANAVCLPTPDLIVQMYHTIRLLCISKSSASTTFGAMQFQPIQSNWADISLHRTACESRRDTQRDLVWFSF